MVAFSSKERGTVGYERYVSADRNTVLVCERYADSASAVAHLKAFAERFAEQFSRMVERKRFIVFGAADKGLKEMLDSFGAEYFSFLDGFDRQS
jgi:quinol monooxygenase YgiN